MTPYFQRQRLRFECTGCGKCCVDDSEGIVRVSRQEAAAMRALLGVSERWFMRRYLKRIDDGWRGIRLRRDGSCPLLGRDMRCRVYQARPLQCRLYPFWPEVVSTQQAWRSEAQRCEGIDRGDEVATEHIVRCLSQDQLYRVTQLLEITS